MTTKVISTPRLSFLIQVADAASNTAGTSRATRSEMRDNAAALRELESRRLPCRWSPIESDVDVFNTCKEGEEFHLTEGLDLWPHCPWCGRKVEVVPLNNPS